MNTDELKDFVTSRLEAGGNMADIKADLKAKGANDADIDWAVNAAQLESHPPPPEPPKAKPRNPALSVLVGVIFIGIGLFRLSDKQTQWDGTYGTLMVVLGVINIVAAIVTSTRK
jgi:hypothetical protein